MQTLDCCVRGYLSSVRVAEQFNIQCPEHISDCVPFSFYLFYCEAEIEITSFTVLSNTNAATDIPHCSKSESDKHR